MTHLFKFPSQASSGTFQMIKDKVFSVLHQVPTADLSIESLSALMAIMLAQAQEAFCLKAIQGTAYPYSSTKYITHKAFHPQSSFILQLQLKNFVFPAEIYQYIHISESFCSCDGCAKYKSALK